MKQNEFYLLSFLFWIALAISFPLFSGNLSFSQSILAILYFLSTYAVGEFCFSGIDEIKGMPPILFTGVFILLGSLISGLLFMLLPFKFITFLIAITFVLIIVLKRRIDFSFSGYHLLFLLPLCVLLFQTFELQYAIHVVDNRRDGDYPYYSAIVESLRTNHTIFNATYHLGLPINYSPLPFIAPAHIAAFLGIRSQFALWGIFLKILPVLSFGVVAYAIVKIYSYLFKHPILQKSFSYLLVIAVLLLMFLGPIHFLKLGKLDFTNVLFLGIGYLLPTGSPGFALTIFIGGLLLLIILNRTFFPWTYKFSYIPLLLCSVVASKMAMFLPLVLFLGALAVFRLFRKEAGLFVSLAIAFPLCILIYKITLGATDSLMQISLTKVGYFNHYFTDLGGKYGIGSSPALRMGLMFVLSILMWLGFKMALYLFAGFKFRKNIEAQQLIFAIIISLVICFLPGFFVDVFGSFDGETKLFDISSDMSQFARAAIFLSTVLLIPFVLFFILDYRKTVVRKISSVFFSIWILLIAYSFFATQFNIPQDTSEMWYSEVESDFRFTSPKLMVIMGNVYFSGQTLSAAGVNPWYCTGFRQNGEGYIFSKAAYSRNELIAHFFDSTSNFSNRKIIKDSLEKVGVDCIVSSPWSEKKINAAVRDSLISKIPGTKWMYKFN